MRYLPCYASVFVLLVGCVSKPADGSGAASTAVAHGSINLTAKGKSKLMPSTAVSPGFSDLNVEVMTADALMSKSTDVAPGGPSSLGHVALQNAAPSCEVVGCQWHLPSIAINATLQGLMSVVTDGRGSDPLWHTTYALVVNANQIQDNVRLGGEVNGFAPAYVLAAAAVDQLAKLVGTDANTLVGRGVGLGLVWSTRGEGQGIGTGSAGAQVKVGGTGGTAPSLYYLDDAMDVISHTGTNQDGLFVLVGPDLTQQGAAAPASYKVPLTISSTSGASVVYSDSYAIVRPGVITVVPVEPIAQ